MTMINTAVLVVLIAVQAIFCGNTNAFTVGFRPIAEIRGSATFGDSSLLLFSAASNTNDSDMPAAAPVETVRILPNIEAVGSEIRKIVRDAAAAAIAERGAFSLAIPGGSILKMLVGTGTGGDGDGDDWTAKTTVAYVNHKCVAMDDAQLATHAKACSLFFGDWSDDCNIIIMDGTDDGDKEAQAYESKLRSLSTDVLPVQDGIPVFDLALIGVGDDGHVGSLYPNREEVLLGTDGGSWVLPVAMKEPPSITLSLPVMQSAKQVVIAAGGVSDKYPQGKSAGMKRAIADETETIQSFPAVGLRSCAIWVVDEAAASELGDSYTTSS